jgi:hypothetical protein
MDNGMIQESSLKYLFREFSTLLSHEKTISPQSSLYGKLFILGKGKNVFTFSTLKQCP